MGLVLVVYSLCPNMGSCEQSWFVVSSNLSFIKWPVWSTLAGVSFASHTESEMSKLSLLSTKETDWGHSVFCPVGAKHQVVFPFHHHNGVLHVMVLIIEQKHYVYVGY